MEPPHGKRFTLLQHTRISTIVPKNRVRLARPGVPVREHASGLAAANGVDDAAGKAIGRAGGPGRCRRRDRGRVCALQADTEHLRKEHTGKTSTDRFPTNIGPLSDCFHEFLSRLCIRNDSASDMTLLCIRHDSADLT